MADRDRTSELLTELINRLSGPVTAGAKLASDAATRRADAQRQLEELCAELRQARDVGRRVVALLDDIEEPLRRAVPVIGRVAGLLEEILDEAPDDVGAQLSALVTRLGGLVDGLAPLMMMAQGAAGMFGNRPAAASSAASSPASTQPATTSTASKRTAVKTTAAKKSPTAKKPVAKKSTGSTASPRSAAAKKSTATKKSASAKKSPAKKAAAKKSTATT